jgi:hypothetical protein
MFYRLLTRSKDLADCAKNLWRVCQSFVLFARAKFKAAIRAGAKLMRVFRSLLAHTYCLFDLSEGANSARRQSKYFEQIKRLAVNSTRSD